MPLVVLTSCVSAGGELEQRVDSLNTLSYHLRYISPDSSLCYARQALGLAGDYPQGRDFATNNLAYAAYQQMRYDSAIVHLDQIYSRCRSQVELLCADVMYMKVGQRTGQGLLFFKHRNLAAGRIRRIMEDSHLLSPLQAARLRYARSEMHIVSSTYYYYYGQEDKAREEIGQAATDATLPQDTAQWIYYRYMLGSGGLLKGDTLEVALGEFDHLFYAYRAAKLHRMAYFQANALQSLATLLSQSATASHIAANRPGALDQLWRDHQQWPVESLTAGPEHLPLALAGHALRLFEEQNDLFQMACASRTVGEICFRHQAYHRALEHFSHALDLVESQKSRSQWPVPFWTLNMMEYLSLCHSALGDKAQSDHYRNLYLDLLEQYTQDYEMEDRKNQLEGELWHTRASLAGLLVLIVLSAVLLLLLRRRLRQQSSRLASRIDAFEESAEWQAFLRRTQAALDSLADRQQELDETVSLHQMSLAGNRRGNVERRAKVGMVQAVVPYLDRILAEVGRMRRTGLHIEGHLRYVSELAAEIMRVNEALTRWIQMKQGQLSLHISTFPLAQVFSIIARSEVVFQRQGLSLRVEPTPLCVKADMALTLFMVNTLCDNARKFTPAGGVVSVYARGMDGAVEISVADTGVGLSQHEVEAICGQKMFVPSAPGVAADGKGFGFGIMNCKGIISKYRKTSAKFAVCQLGVESRVGQGSRFWFRLPGVAAILCALLFATAAQAHPADSIIRANIEGRYAQALEMGRNYVQAQTHPIDTPRMMSVLNEMAVSAMALGEWEQYDNTNRSLVRLHSLYTADESLPAYCRQMQQMKGNNIFVYAFLVLLALLALTLFCLLSLRGILRRDTYSHSLRVWLDKQMQQAAARAEAVAAMADTAPSLPSPGQPQWMANLPTALTRTVQTFSRRVDERMSLVREMAAKVEQRQATAHRLEYEKNRLYVANQVLDNCLSTIKHETMYYPARTQQLAEAMLRTAARDEGLAELEELVGFYRQVYMLLLQQALRQTEQSSIAPRPVRLSQIDGKLPPIDVMADPTLLSQLMDMLRQAEGCEPTLEARTEPPMAVVTATYACAPHTEDELASLFQPTGGHIPLLVAKQIIREHDATCLRRPLRLTASPAPEGYVVQFTLPLTSIRDKQSTHTPI